jgi:hypothetical protein
MDDAVDPRPLAGENTKNVTYLCAMNMGDNRRMSSFNSRSLSLNSNIFFSCFITRMVNSSNKMNHNQRQTGYTSVVDCNMTKKKKKKQITAWKIYVLTYIAL